MELKTGASQGKESAEAGCFLTGFCPCYREILREWFNVNHLFVLLRLKAGYILAIACLLSASGCTTGFKYAPHHDASYSSAAKHRGVQIERGETRRVAKSEDEISWSKSEHYEPTEADIDMAVEEASGKPVKPTNLAAGIASMRQRIGQLEAEKTKLLNQLDTANDDSSATLYQHLASLNKDLATARERLAHYETQLGKQN